MPRLTVPIAMRWADIDGYGHLNNATAFTLLEEARIKAFWGKGVQGEQVAESALLTGGVGDQTMTLIVRQEIEYLRPIPYVRTPLQVQIWVCSIGGASVEVAYLVPDHTGAAAISALTTIVLVDAETGRPRRLTDQERAGWQAWMDERPQMRNR